MATPAEPSRAVATGETTPAPTPPDTDTDTKALAKEKPIFVYFYVDPISDPMDSNYKFSRKFEMGVISEEIADLINKNFVAKKVALPADADMKKVENQARVEIWSPTSKMVGRLTGENEATLNKAPFIAFAKSRLAKSQKLVKDEIARIEKARKEQAEKKGETAKND